MMKSDKMRALAIFIAAILVFTVLLTPISATVYDFQDPINNKAYEGNDTNRPAGVPPDYEAELGAPEYVNISTFDGNTADYSHGSGYDLGVNPC